MGIGLDLKEAAMGNTKKLPPIELNQDTIDGINGEFAYHSTLQGSGRADARDHGVEGQLVTLVIYTIRALEAWTENPGDEAALNALRKVAATAARPLVIYGCPKRKLPVAEKPRSFFSEVAEHDEAVRQHEDRVHRIAVAQSVKLLPINAIDADMAIREPEIYNMRIAAATKAIYDDAKGPRKKHVRHHVEIAEGGAVSPQEIARSIQNELRQMVEDTNSLHAARRLCSLDAANKRGHGSDEAIGWEEIARQESRNSAYYRSLVVEIGELFGEAAYTCDDGSKADSVLCAKVPALAREALAKPDPISVGDVVILKHEHNHVAPFRMTVGRIDGAGDAACNYFLNSVLTTKTIPAAALKKVA